MYIFKNFVTAFNPENKNSWWFTDSANVIKWMFLLLTSQISLFQIGKYVATTCPTLFFDDPKLSNDCSSYNDTFSLACYLNGFLHVIIATLALLILRIVSELIYYFFSALTNDCKKIYKDAEMYNLNHKNKKSE